MSEESVCISCIASLNGKLKIKTKIEKAVSSEVQFLRLRFFLDLSLQKLLHPH